VPRLALLVCLLGGCGSEDPTSSILVDVQTDLTPGVDFASIDVVATPAGTETGMTTRFEDVAGRDFAAGVRVAELDGLPVGSVRVSAVLEDADRAFVGERATRVELGAEPYGLTLRVCGACEGLDCSGGTEPLVCDCGRCVPVDCHPENPEACPTGVCDQDIDCGASSDCVTPTCTSDGLCLFPRNDSVCATGEYCSLDMGCTAIEGCGEACSTGNPCTLGTLDCSAPGLAVCIATSAPGGTPCGSTGECDGMGGCVEP
jgi:hypothetical protein